MSRTQLRRKIDNLLAGVPEDEAIRIFYRNPETGETTELESFPDRTSLNVTVDDPATAETLKKLRGLTT
jgi:hypothetical protein